MMNKYRHYTLKEEHKYRPKLMDDKKMHNNFLFREHDAFHIKNKKSLSKSQLIKW
jgi:hypothetical protein